MITIDLNADLGEGGAYDAELMAIVTSANIACGGHAGDESTMRTAVSLATRHGVAIGAHPGYEDPEHFGRVPLDLASEVIHDIVSRQLERLLAIHPDIHHVKPHGALYHQSNGNPSTAEAVLRAMADLVPAAVLYAPPTGELATAAARHGIRHVAEGFIDRRYQPDGTLTPRTCADAVIDEPADALAQALQIARHQAVTTSDGTIVSLPARTLCVHGDSPQAVAILRTVRIALER